MDREIILARVSWKKVTYVLCIPVIFLVVWYVIFSNLPVNEIFSHENLVRPRPYRPSLEYSVLALLAFVGIFARRFYIMAASKGRYLWIDGDDLMFCTKKVADIEDIISDSITITSMLSPYLTLERRKEGALSIPIGFGEYDEKKLIADLREAVRADAPD